MQFLTVRLEEVLRRAPPGRLAPFLRVRVSRVRDVPSWINRIRVESFPERVMPWGRVVDTGANFQ